MITKERVLTKKQVTQREIGERLKIFKKELRKKATPAEKIFKKTLKEYKLKATFQKPFYRVDGLRCIADFFFRDKPNIIVEIDGGYHNSSEQQRKDDFRTNWLNDRRNCRVIRFTNNEVLNYLNDCILKLADFYINSIGEPSNPSENYKILQSIKNNNLCQ